MTGTSPALGYVAEVEVRPCPDAGAKGAVGELGLCAKRRCGPAVTHRLLGLQPSLGLAVLPALETLLAGTRACFWDGRWACANVAVGGHPGSPVPALSRLLLLAAWRCLSLLLLRAGAAKFRTLLGVGGGVRAKDWEI